MVNSECIEAWKCKKCKKLHEDHKLGDKCCEESMDKQEEADMNLSNILSKDRGKERVEKILEKQE